MVNIIEMYNADNYKDWDEADKYGAIYRTSMSALEAIQAASECITGDRYILTVRIKTVSGDEA